MLNAAFLMEIPIAMVLCHGTEVSRHPLGEHHRRDNNDAGSNLDVVYRDWNRTNPALHFLFDHRSHLYGFHRLVCLEMEQPGK